MSKAKAYGLIAVLLVVIGSSGCKSKQPGGASNGQTTNGNANAQVELQPGGVAGGKAMGGTVFRGTIGDKKIQMLLSRENNQLSGTYSYQKIGSDISLKGSINAQGDFSLQEFDSSGKQTGEFKGKWTEPAELPTASLEGTWSKPASKDTLSFFATEQGVTFNSGARVVSKEIKEENKKLKYTVNVEYPELTGVASPNVDKFNQEVKSLVTNEVRQFKAGVAENSADEQAGDSTTGSDIQMSYNVSHATDELISLIFDVSTYSQGAAHPNGNALVLNFDLKNGRALKLADLFKPKSDYLNSISRFAIGELKKQGGQDIDTDWLEKGAGPEADNFSNWNISKRGLAITFDPYQVASYAEGPKHVIIPFASIKDMAKPDGPLSSLMNKS